ncbi:NUDIX domain-containing protein [Streptomyces mirabilis]|uniref:NUDIX domain-containing protein n=1 Tax=Streptomyces mirabilis TaxID=68239 RepID=UPI003333D661
MRAGRVLLIRRSVPAASLLWTFPSGKAEPGETAGHAAAREALEEAGVVVEPVSLLGERVHPATGWPVAYVACRLLSGTAHTASPREVAEVRWVRLGAGTSCRAGCSRRCRRTSRRSWPSSHTWRRPRPDQRSGPSSTQGRIAVRLPAPGRACRRSRPSPSSALRVPRV